MSVDRPEINKKVIALVERTFVSIKPWMRSPAGKWRVIPVSNLGGELRMATATDELDFVGGSHCGSNPAGN
jgi:hypothetical protein